MVSSNDFCNTIRNVDTPSELFAPRTCGPAEAGTRFPLIAPLPTTIEATSSTPSPSLPLRARGPRRTGRDHRDRGTPEDLIEIRRESSPSSTLSRAPVVIDARARILERSAALHRPRPIPKRPIREERTPCDEPRCLSSSTSAPTPVILPCGTRRASRQCASFTFESTYASFTFPEERSEETPFPLTGASKLFDGSLDGKGSLGRVIHAGAILVLCSERSALTISTTEEPRG